MADDALGDVLGDFRTFEYQSVLKFSMASSPGCWGSGPQQPRFKNILVLLSYKTRLLVIKTRLGNTIN